MAARWLKADIIVHKVSVDGSDVLTWFDLHTSAADPTGHPGP